jgi:predicted transcriptional regulator of viral defense system
MSLSAASSQGPPSSKRSRISCGVETSSEIHNVAYQFITITEKKFFGYNTESIGTYRINVASVEKAIADCADHPEYCGGITELGKALKNAEDLDTETLADYLAKIGNGAAIKRIVYLADLYGISLEKREILEDAFTEGYSKLDPTQGEGKHSRKYRLQLNVPEDELKNTGERY